MDWKCFKESFACLFGCDWIYSAKEPSSYWDHIRWCWRPTEIFTKRKCSNCGREEELIGHKWKRTK